MHDFSLLSCVQTWRKKIQLLKFTVINIRFKSLDCSRSVLKFLYVKNRKASGSITFLQAVAAITVLCMLPSATPSLFVLTQGTDTFISLPMDQSLQILQAVEAMQCSLSRSTACCNLWEFQKVKIFHAWFLGKLIKTWNCETSAKAVTSSSLQVPYRSQTAVVLTFTFLGLMSTSWSKALSLLPWHHLIELELTTIPTSLLSHWCLPTIPMFRSGPVCSLQNFFDCFQCFFGSYYNNHYGFTCNFQLLWT